MLLETKADVFSDGVMWTLEGEGDSQFAFGVMGEHGAPTSAQTPVEERTNGMSATYTARVATVALHADVTPGPKAGVRRAFEMGPSLSWRPKPIAMAPDDTDFAKAAGWSVRVPAVPASGQLADVLVRVRYEGDVARMYSGGSLLDDNFWNGLPWEVGLAEVGALSRRAQTLQIRILPLPRTYPMFLEDPALLHFRGASVGSLLGVDLIPRYRLRVEIPPK
jgi:hypothetical protein